MMSVKFKGACLTKEPVVDEQQLSDLARAQLKTFTQDGVLNQRLLQNKKKELKAVFAKNKLWENGSNIKVAWMGGEQWQHDWVKNVIEKSVLPHVNLSILWDAPMQSSDVRITFDSSGGAWSMIGIDSKTLQAPDATMNLGWLDDAQGGNGSGAVVKHEFCHAFGMLHEHQNPRGEQIPWDREFVIEELSGDPNYWDLQTIEFNVFAKNDLESTNGSGYDPKSIMIYPHPPSWTTDGSSAEIAWVLSDLDKEWLRKNYPGKAVDTTPDPTEDPTSEPPVTTTPPSDTTKKDLLNLQKTLTVAVVVMVLFAMIISFYIVSKK